MNDKTGMTLQPADHGITMPEGSGVEFVFATGMADGSYLAPAFPGTDGLRERRTVALRQILDLAQRNPNFLAELDGPTSTMIGWDGKVYAECLSRLRDPWFLWKSNHWAIDRTELLRRVKAWNAALEEYCNDINLQGEERACMIQQYTASPLAHCGCPGCGLVEEQVKVFKRCSLCRQIAYCSPACQRKDWRDHKKVCSGRRKERVADVCSG